MLTTMNRKLRREISKRKWISRAKKIYYSWKNFYVPSLGINGEVRYDCDIRYNPYFRKCESITDFLDSSKFAKSLKKLTKGYKDISNKLDTKIQNRKERYKTKRDIQEGLQEYDSLDDYTCSSCMFYNKGLCEKGLSMTENCPEYFD